MRTLLTLLSLIFISEIANAYGTCPLSAPEGAQRRIGSQPYFCDGSEWQAMGDGNSTGDTCTAGEIGIQKYDMDNLIGRNGMIYCDGSDWISLTVQNSSDLAICTSPGRQRYYPTGQTMEYCPGGVSQWVSMKTSAVPGIVLCNLQMTQGTCEAVRDCYWNAGFCDDCACRRP